jgi:hypothetical protein
MRVHRWRQEVGFMRGMYKLKCLICVAVWENTQRFMDGIGQEMVGLEPVELDHFSTKDKAV